MDASRIRKQLYEHQRQVNRQLRCLKEHRPFIRGIVYKLRRKCGKEGCRCMQGESHESWVLAVSEKGRKRMRMVPKGKRMLWAQMTERYRRFRRARADLVKLFAEIIKLVDWVISTGGLLAAFGPELGAKEVDRKTGELRIECKGFNDKNAYPRQTPCDPDFLRKIAKDTEAEQLTAWFNAAVQQIFHQHRYFDKAGIFIGDAS